MNILFETEKALSVARIAGRLDTESSQEAERILLNRLPECSKWLIDLEKLEFISSAGLRVFLLLAKEARKNNIKLVLASLRAPVFSIFEISGFCSLFLIADDIPAGIKLLD